MFNISKTEQNYSNLPRYLQAKRFGKHSMNISDVNETMMHMYIIPSEFRQQHIIKNKFEFTWKVVYFRWNFMYLQLNFTNPGYVSSIEDLDSFVLKVNSSWSHLFYSKVINKDLDPGWFNMTHPIPR